MKDCKITEAEAQRVLIKSVSDRPNALMTYGEAKKDANETKDLFDRQFQLMRERHNLLNDEVVQEVKLLREEAEEEAKETDEKIEALYGASGEVVIPVSAWSGTSATVTVEGVGDKDVILFSPKSGSDRLLLNASGVFISPAVTGGVVSLTATVKPTAAITLVYFIMRGA